MKHAICKPVFKDEKTWRDLLVLFALVSLLCAVIFIPYIVNDQAFILGLDMRTIYSSNFEGLRTMLAQWRQNGSLPFWNWSNFLGNDFYSSKLFYFNDLWEYLFALGDLPYTTAILWMTYLRFLSGAFSFYAYARYNHAGHRVSILASLFWAFSSYMLQVMRDPFFATFTAFLPLYFLSVDRYIVEKKHGFFIFMVFFMFFNNYYLFYMTSLFTILYYLWRHEKEYGTLHDVMKPAVRLIGFYLVGFSCAGFFVVPEILNILGNSRLGVRDLIWSYGNPTPYLDIVNGLYTPASMLAYRSTPASTLYMWLRGEKEPLVYNIWAGALMTLLVPQLFTKKNRRPMTLWCFAVCALLSFIPIFSSAMHGFSEPSFRWTSNLTFLLLAMVLPLLNDAGRIDRNLLKKSAVAFVILIAVSPVVCAAVNRVALSEIVTEYRWLLVDDVLFVLIAWALLAGKRKTVAAAALAELAMVSYFSFYGNPAMRSLTIPEAKALYTALGEKDAYNSFTLSLDEKNWSSLYRTYINLEDVFWENLGMNHALDGNIRGVTTYDSTYLASSDELVQLDPDHIYGHWSWSFDIENQDVLDLVSVKYGVTGLNTACPFKNGRLVTTYMDTWNIWENLDYINLGKTYTDLETWDDYDPSKSADVIAKVICHAEDAEEIRSLLGKEEVVCDTAEADGRKVYAWISTTENGFAVLSVPYDEGWSATVNGQPARIYEVNGGLSGIAVPAGGAEIQMTFTPKGLKKGIVVSGIGVLLVLGTIVLDRRRKKVQA